MAHGQPDFGMYSAKKTVGSMADNAELAARLGSICTFDRRGDIVWFDDFEALYNKWTELGGADRGPIIQSDNRAKRGTHSLEITTGPLGGGGTGAYHEEGYPVFSNFGFEAHVHLYHAAIRVYLEAHIYTGARRYRAYLGYERDNNRWIYLDNGGVERVLLAGVTYPYGINLFVPFKFVIDVTNVTYLRGIFSNQEVDMSTILVQDGPDLITAPHLYIAIRAYSPGTPGQVSYFDNVIITQNEP